MRNLKFSWVQIVWAVAAFALLEAGIHVINIPDGQLMNVVEHLGLSMLFAGCINLLVYWKKKEEIHGSHWLLAEGMSTALLTIFLLFNEMTMPAVIPFFFGIWELFSGILKFIDALELKEEGVRGWQWFEALGTFELLSGVASMLKPIDEAVGMNHVIAIIFFVQCAGFVFKIFVYHNLLEIISTKKEV